MYYPMLEKLKDFNPELIKKFDQILFLIYKNQFYKRFNPKTLTEFYDDLDDNILIEWARFLNQLVNQKLLKMCYEIMCPDCYDSIIEYDNYNSIPFDDFLSHEECDLKFRIREENIFITYSFTDNLLTFSLNIEHDESFFFRKKQIKKMKFPLHIH